MPVVGGMTFIPIEDTAPTTAPAVATKHAVLRRDVCSCNDHNRVTWHQQVVFQIDVEQTALVAGLHGIVLEVMGFLGQSYNSFLYRLIMNTTTVPP